MSLPSSLLPNTSLPKAQFRAVVVCGFGSELYPLVEPVHAVVDGPGTNAANAADGDDDASNGGPEGTYTVDTDANAPPSGVAQPGASLRSGKQGQTKALLPVGGRRMVDWVLERIEEAGVFDILVLAPESIAAPMAHHLRARRSAPSTSSSAPSAKVELEEVPDGVARRGVVQVMRWTAESMLIKTDFIFLPCDLLLVPTNASPSISLASLLDRHRTDDNLMTTLFSERGAGNVVEARKDGPPEVLTIYDHKTSTLLDVREMDDYDEDEVPLRTSMLTRFPSPTITTALLPTQIYVFSQKVVPLLTSPENARRIRQMDNIRDFVAWVCRLAWRNKGRDAIGYRPRGQVDREDGLAMGRSTTQPPSVWREATSAHARAVESNTHTGANTPALTTRGSWRANSVDFSASGAWSDRSKTLLANAPSLASKHAGNGGCKIVIWRAADGWAGRGNTVAGYVEMNRAALKIVPPHPAPTNTPSGVFVSSDSHVHPSAFGNMGEKVGIKRCIIGKNCFIGKGTKLTNVLMMDNVHLGENVKLENCVVSDNVHIRDRAALKDCELGRDVIVDFDVQMKNEQLVVDIE